jgi:NADPH-dependent curcumin reductase CurA
MFKTKNDLSEEIRAKVVELLNLWEILSKSLTVRGFLNYDFAAEHYAAFLREVGAGIAEGRIRYREDFVEGLERAPEAFLGMLEGRNFGKLIVRMDA